MYAAQYPLNWQETNVVLHNWFKSEGTNLFLTHLKVYRFAVRCHTRFFLFTATGDRLRISNIDLQIPQSIKSETIGPRRYALICLGLCNLFINRKVLRLKKYSFVELISIIFIKLVKKK